LYSFLIGSPFLQAETLTPCRRAGADDSEVLSSFLMHDDEDVARGRETNEQKPHLDAAAVRIVEGTRLRVEKSGRGLLERDSVLLAVGGGFCRVPLEGEAARDESNQGHDESLPHAVAYRSGQPRVPS
jgi:hypothetical protein